MPRDRFRDGSAATLTGGWDDVDGGRDIRGGCVEVDDSLKRVEVDTRRAKWLVWLGPME